MYEIAENGEKKWKGDGKLLKDQTLYQESINKQFDGVSSSIYEEMPPSVGYVTEKFILFLSEENIYHPTYLPFIPSLHLRWMFIQPCNFRCSYCFAVFDDLHGQYLNKQQNLQLCHLLSQKFKKITFLGGEPTLIPYLKEMLIIAKSYHATTSIITNGYRLNDENYLKEFVGLLDWITVSIDSANPEVHAALGRGFGPRKKTSTAAPAVEDPEKQVKPLTNEHYFEVARLIKKYGFKFKISTVVNQLNKDEGPSSSLPLCPAPMFFSPRDLDMSKFIRTLSPCRWKLFQCLYLEGENSGRVEHLLITKSEMEAFISRHEHLTTLPNPIALYSSNEETKNGYACITPAGCFLDDIDNKHRYSRPILSVGVEKAWSDIDYRPENFRARGGYYQWEATTSSSASGSAACGEEKDIEDLCGATGTNRNVCKKINSIPTLLPPHDHKEPTFSSQQVSATTSCPRANLSSPLNAILSVSVAAVAMMIVSFVAPQSVP